MEDVAIAAKRERRGPFDPLCAFDLHLSPLSLLYIPLDVFAVLIKERLSKHNASVNEEMTTVIRIWRTVKRGLGVQHVITCVRIWSDV